jgi:hypothetical protein
VPTYQRSPGFNADWKSLSAEDKKRFRAALDAFVTDLRGRSGFRNGLRVKGVQGARGTYEMTWAPDGRATFSYGPEQRTGEPHIVLRRIGDHSIFMRP